MSADARETIRDLSDRLGSALLNLVAGELNDTSVIDDVVVHAPSEPLAVTPGAVVCAVGAADDSASICALLVELGAAGAAALVMRNPVAVDAKVEAAARAAGVPVFGLVAGVPWMYLADVIRPARGWREEDGVANIASLEADLNLFKVANTLAGVLDAPVTIEDTRSRVMAFSADQERGDEARKATVLGQRVPPRFGTQIVRLGVFQRLYSSDRPIYVDSFSDEHRARVAIQVRAGDTLLGSIWAIAGDEPLTEAQSDAMVRAAHTAAAAILQGRAAGDTIRRIRTGTVTALIGGGQGARAAAGRMRRGRVHGGCVLAARVRSSDRPRVGATLLTGAEEFASALVMSLRSECAAAVAAVIDDTVYAVLLNGPDCEVDPSALRSRVQTWLARRVSGQDQLLVGIGNAVADAADLDHSREDAELVLRVLDMPETGRGGGSHVATRDDVHGLSLVLRLSDIAATDPVSAAGPLTRLEAYDSEHQSNLVETLACWLEQFGDVTLTAERLHVHKNTLRYRLGRIEEVSGVNLANSDERFELMLQLRVRQSLRGARRVEPQRRGEPSREPEAYWSGADRGYAAPASGGNHLDDGVIAPFRLHKIVRSEEDSAGRPGVGPRPRQARSGPGGSFE